MMEPTQYEAVADPEASVYFTNPDLDDPRHGPGEIRSMAIRPDVAPRHDLFYDRFFGTVVLCTDRFAMRILKAGCTGMAFDDPRGSIDGKCLCRTLRGIEQYDGAGEGFLERTKLIQAIA